MPVKKPTDKPVKKASAKRAANHSGRTTTPAPITSGSEWGREAKAARVNGRPLTVPSGKTCLVKMLNSMQEFLARGSVPNALLPMMQEAATGQGVDEGEITKLVTSDPEKLRDMFDMVDLIVIECVLEPPVSPVPQETDDDGNVTMIPAHLRPDDDTLYVDYIELEDKMFIFNYALSGVSDLDKFRQITNPSLVAVPTIEDVGESAKRHPSNTGSE